MTVKVNRIIALLLMVLLLTALCACGKTGGSGKEGAATLDYSGLYDYAKRLEAEGNDDAAAAVYEIIIRNGGSDFLADMHEDNPLVKLDDEINEVEEIFGRKGGDGK